MTPVVFAGPSVYGLAAGELAGFDLRPPAGCGDLLKAARDGATSIGLIDGLFETVPSVWHKEILAAIDAGATVFGAASLGALRAAECCAFGMIGVGAVFRSYQSGARTSDADVAVLHAPAELGYMPLTEALVDIEAGLAAMRAEGSLTVEEASRLGAAARRLHFSRRAWADIGEASGLSADRGAAIARCAARLGVSQKRDDAGSLLDAMRCGGAAVARRSSQPLSRTYFLIALETRLARRSAG